jgi:cytochrome c556
MLPFCVAPACGDHRGEELKTMKRMILTAALLAGVVSGTAWAQSAADAINQRQAGFKAIAAATGDIKRVMDASGDLTTVAAKAEEVSAFGKRIPALFPAGSGTESGQRTRALAAIWQNKSDFDANAGIMVREADRLAAALKANDRTATAAAFGAMTAQCGVCHRPYRAPQ